MAFFSPPKKPFRTFLFIFSPLLWFALTAILYTIINLLYRKTGFVKLLLLLGFIGIAFSPFDLIAAYFVRNYPQTKILTYILLAWSTYLKLMAISTIYSISKTKVFFAFLIGSIILIILFFVGFLLYVKLLA